MVRIVLSVACFALAPTVALAAPLLEFDADFTVACRDITSAQFARAHPDKKLVEARFRLSAKLLTGSEKDLEDVIYTLRDKHHRLRIADYAPRTELASDIAEPILAVDYKGNGSLRYALTHATGFIKAEYDAGKYTYKKLPPLEATVASGISERGYGVFFKLRATDRVTLEGDHDCRCVFEVPRSWRGDILLVKCEANGINRGLVPYLDTRVRAGLAGFYIGLYLDGDEEAEKLARDLALEQQTHFCRMVEMQKSKGLFPNLIASLTPASSRPPCEVQQAMEVNLHLLEGVSGHPAEAAAFFDRLHRLRQAISQLER